MKRFRYYLATPVWYLCGFLDRLPWYDDGWMRHGGVGCYPLRISRLAVWIEGA